MRREFVGFITNKLRGVGLASGMVAPRGSHDDLFPSVSQLCVPLCWLCFQVGIRVCVKVVQLWLTALSRKCSCFLTNMAEVSGLSLIGQA